MRRRLMSRTARTHSAVAALLVIAATVSLCALTGWPWLADYLLGISLITLGYYGLDKAAARRNWRRVPESVLHGLAFFGGAPGALLGQQLFRHKRAKQAFQRVFWLICALQVLALCGFIWLQLRV